MSEVDGKFVKRGLWTDLEKGPIMGKVITTDTETGLIVIALLAILSALGTTHLWHLIAFAYHQIRADGRKGNGIYRQQQALLRQLPTPSSLMADSVKLWWSWRKRSDHAIAATVTPLLLALLCTIGTLAASIASSYVVDSTNLHVLVNSPYCGRLNLSETSIQAGGYNAAILALSEPYAQECYQKNTRNDTALPARCRAFVQPDIDLQVKRTPCPYETKMCIGSDASLEPAVTIDSGLVDLNDGFGLNMVDLDRVKFRKRTSCGVLPVDGYTTLLNASDFPQTFMGRPPLPSEEVMLYHYGPRPALGEWANMTGYNSFAKSNITRTFGVTGGYIHYASDARPNPFNLLPEMDRTDADVELIMVSKNSVESTSPIEDLMFTAHKNFSRMEAASYTNVTIYLADNPITGVACTQQYQFCIASKSGDICSSLDGLPANTTALNFTSASDIQLAALQILLDTNAQSHIGSNRAVRLTSMVEARGVLNAPVPDDQWITEIHGWESFVWASLQTRVSDYAVGPQVRHEGSAEYTLKPDSDGFKQLCMVQRMRKSGGFVNINVFGLVFIVGVSSFLAIFDIALLKILIYMSRFRRALAPRIDRWIQDGVLQMQRRAYEAQGEGTWTNLDQEIPLILKKETLSDLPNETFALKREKTIPFMLRRADTDLTLITSPTAPSSAQKSIFNEKQVTESPVSVNRGAHNPEWPEPRRPFRRTNTDQTLVVNSPIERVTKTGFGAVKISSPVITRQDSRDWPEQGFPYSLEDMQRRWHELESPVGKWGAPAKDTS